ncbi:MAG: imidazole glycerol phosphate synthase subunit HisF [Bacteroidia bacterium]|nr:imidazole glycerol phosphate synthase subunit HisF [Bacteroidia bacterium]
MLTKRIIPCLDVKDGKTVKGVSFENLREAGDAVELGARYVKEGADELIFLDITATNEKRRTLTELVSRVAEVVNIPFTVGGGVTSVDDVHALLACGADKISVNSAAVRRPELLTELASRFGSQCVVLAVDAKKEENDWYVYLNGGRMRTDLRVRDWVREVCNRGAGEILLTSMDADGTRKGFDLALTSMVSHSVPVPVIASGGAGTIRDFENVFREGCADAALAASIFHFREVEIAELKKYLTDVNIPVRPV